MIRFKTAIAAALLSTISFAQDSASVLFIGNSYTGANNLPQMVHDLTVSLGDELHFDAQTPGGTTFEGHTNNAATFTKIQAQPWNYVVLQGQSQEPSFPDAQVNTASLPYVMELADSVYSNNACSQVLFYMTWGRENGDPQWAPISTFAGMNGRLRNAYLRFADSVSGSVSPVGSAWAYVRENHPTIDLYTGDGSHPNVNGSYLAACTFYASIFRKSPVGATFTSSVTPANAAILQNAAALTVLDSLQHWSLRPAYELALADFTFAVNQGAVNFTNDSEHTDTYSWDFGDGNTSTDENPTHNYASTGTFSVQLIADGPCGDDTISYDVTINTVSLDENELNFSIKPVTEGVYEISGDVLISSMNVIGLSGRQVAARVPNDTAVMVDLSNQPKGIYLIQLVTDSGAKTIRLSH